MEIFKPISGYESSYEVSSYGRVRSLNRKVNSGLRHNATTERKGRVLKPNKKRNGYLTVDLSANNKVKTVSIHRLVGLAFLPKVNGKIFINHINGNKEDNRYTNLEWVTAQENSQHAYLNLNIPIKGRKQICCVETNKIFESSTQAAEWINCQHGRTKQVYAMARRIRAVCTGKQQTAYGYHWKDLVKVEGSTTIP